MAFKILQNAFPAGALPGPSSRSLRRSPDPLVGWGGDIPPRTLPPLDSPAFLRLHFGGGLPPNIFRLELSLNRYELLQSNLKSHIISVGGNQSINES